MPLSTASAEPADYLNVNSRYVCVQCRGNLIRIPRRPIDRFWSLFTPVQRFRCNQFSCQWIGNLPIDGKTSSGTASYPDFK